MVQGLRRRRVTTALIIIPCILSVLTLISAWILPSSTFHNFLRRFTGDHGSPTLVSRPKISDPNEKEKQTNKKNENKEDKENANEPKHEKKKTNGRNKDNLSDIAAISTSNSNSSAENWMMVPNELLDMGVYDEALDFVNEKGIKPTGWEHPNGDPNVWGPCRFVSSPNNPEAMASLEWSDRRRRPPSSSNNNSTGNVEMSLEYHRNADITDFKYLGSPTSHKRPNPSNGDIGWCRPGFLIIGAGKCGTSSLYHYLVGHPRVLPAKQKQIHYFKYHDHMRPLEWYYGNFPTPQSFLEHGGLVTGEASPGYLPYPDVARNAYKAWKGSSSINGAGVASNGKPLSQFLANPSYKSMVPEVPPRIFALGREPLDRIYSSYKYSYVVPTIQYLREKFDRENKDTESTFQLHREDDDYYLPYLYTLEDFVRAELKQLRGCLYDWGPGKTYNKWHRDATYKKALELRNGNNSTGTNSSTLSQPLIDLGGVCYGNAVSKTVYREQWKEMQTKDPRKVLLNKNLMLMEAFIGRSLYVFPLDWWYLNFRPDPNDASTSNSITFVCTEDLAKPDTLNDLSAKLGLPKYDGFDAILAEGAFNVGGHQGYDKATSWEDIELEHENSDAHSDAESRGNDAGSSAKGNQAILPMANGIPLPEDLYQELKEFINPFNERLFALTGKRCDW